MLCRPGKYYLRKAITVDAPETALVRIESMELPRAIQPRFVMSVPVDAAPVFHRRRSSSRTFRDILSCRSIDVEENEEDEPMTTMMTEDMAAEEYPEQLVRSASSPASSSSSSSVLPRPSTHFTTCHRATLILKTRKENEPLIRVLRGTCKLKGLQLRHVCHGTGTFKIYYYIHVTLLFAASSLTSRP